MRVTSNTFPNALAADLSMISNRQSKLQTQAATGQRIQDASDDPVGMRRVLDMQGESKAVGQYQRNLARQGELLQATFTGVKGIKSILDRASEIATRAVSTASPAELKIFAAETSELIKQGVHLLNAKNRGDSLFAGTKVENTPFEIIYDAAGLVSEVRYTGNGEVFEAEISEEVTLSPVIPGENTSGNGPRGLVKDQGSGADLFGHLVQLQQHLSEGKKNDIAKNVRPALKKDEENLLFHLGSNSALQARVEVTETVLRQRGESLEGLISHEADADLAQTMVKLSQTQTAYQAALQCGGTILGKSLLDFLR